jgi:hypothetical protein
MHSQAHPSLPASQAPRESGLFSRREKVRFIFDCFDSDRDGRLSEGELQQLLLAINKKLQESSYFAVEQAVDKVYQVGGGCRAGIPYGLQGYGAGAGAGAGMQERGGTGTGAAEEPAAVAGANASRSAVWCSMSW